MSDNKNESTNHNYELTKLVTRSNDLVGSS